MKVAGLLLLWNDAVPLPGTGDTWMSRVRSCAGAEMQSRMAQCSDVLMRLRSPPEPSAGGWARSAARRRRAARRSSRAHCGCRL